MVEKKRRYHSAALLFSILLIAAALMWHGGLFPRLIPRAASGDAIWPEASEEYVLEDGNLHMDASHSEDGYVMVKVISPTANRMKMQVVFSSGAQLLYDIDSSGEYEILPLQLGSGAYSFSLFENVEGTKYAAGGRVDISVQLTSENAAFLVPNQYVEYTRESPSVAQSDVLAGEGTPSEIFARVCDYMASEFEYDYVRASSISPGELPEVDECFTSRIGICQDLSSVMISMLRVQGIPSRLMIGYVDGYYHAWTVSIVDGEEKFFDPTAAITDMAAGTYTTERFY